MNTVFHPDCEVVSLLYDKLDFKTLLGEITNSEFAALVAEFHKDNLVVKIFRDPFGVRPLFYGEDDKGYYFSSTLSGIASREAVQVPPGHYLEIKMGKLTITRYFNIVLTKAVSSLEDIYSTIRGRLIASVHSMLSSDRKLGAMLSGGLDSSLVVAIASRELKKYSKKLYTYSIGLPGSTDKGFALLVAEHCNAGNLRNC